MAAGSFTTGASNFYAFSNYSTNTWTSTTGRSVSAWDTNEVIPNVATSRTTNAGTYIQFGNVTLYPWTGTNPNTVSHNYFIGASSNKTSSTASTQTMNESNPYTYQLSSAGVTFGAIATSSGRTSFQRSDAGYGTITDSHGNSWTTADLRSTITYFTAPAQVTGVSATTTGPTSIQLDWTAPNNGGTTLLGYRILYSSDNWSTTNVITTYESDPSTTQVITGLSAATSYQFVIAAHSGMTDNLRTVKSVSDATGPYSAAVSASTLAGGARLTSSTSGAKTALSTAKRYTGSAWVDLTVRKRYNGSAWVDLSNS